MEERLEALEKRVAALEAELERERENGWVKFFVAVNMPPVRLEGRTEAEAFRQEYVRRLSEFAVKCKNACYSNWRGAPNFALEGENGTECCTPTSAKREVFPTEILSAAQKNWLGETPIGGTPYYENGKKIYGYNAEALAGIITRAESVPKAKCDTPQ